MVYRRSYSYLLLSAPNISNDKMLRFVAIFAVICLAHGRTTEKPSKDDGQKQIIYLAERPQGLPEIQQKQQYNTLEQLSERQLQQQQHLNQQPQQIHQQQPQQLHQQQPQLQLQQQQQYAPQDAGYFALLEPQFQYPGINFYQDKQPYPRVQPQILYYGPGGHGGQPFLLQPGSPPGNFLVPQQPGPNVILREQPERPIFVAGYPKPAHIPPVEKDAEEIPTNPAKIPPIATGRKPEKLETFNEGKEYPTKTAGEADVLAAADRNPQFNPKPSLRPGQRFFILNGQHLFANDPFQSFGHSNVNLKYALNYPRNSAGAEVYQQKPLQQESGQIPIQNYFLRNAVTGQISDVNQNEFNVEPNSQFGEKFGQNVVALNQPNQEASYFRSNLPLNRESLGPEVQFGLNDNSEAYFQYQGDDADNEAIIIDAKVQDDGAVDAESEVVNASEKVAEPSVSQAQPGAIALAGPGGVAGAAPRGTAFVGDGGLAVSSPQATAIAGPSRNESQNKPKKSAAKKTT